MGWNALIEDTHDLFAEAAMEGLLNEAEAKKWASRYIGKLSIEQRRDIAHFMNISSNIHPARLKAELVKKMIQEMLNF